MLSSAGEGMHCRRKDWSMKHQYGRDAYYGSEFEEKKASWNIEIFVVAVVAIVNHTGFPWDLYLIHRQRTREVRQPSSGTTEKEALFWCCDKLVDVEMNRVHRWH
jgi:hypothetical protein